MDCEERLLAQAEKTAALAGGRGVRVFVYRNLVKALPWFQTVREKLLSPAHAGWFLRFDPKRKGNYSVPDCDHNYSPPICSEMYHDQEQTPSHGQPHPDGNCSEPCDCGPGLPCGEYLFDHR